jgi:uncharacterized protein (TIGR02270 family)
LSAAFVNRPIVDVIVSQHIEDLAILWNTRSVLLSAGSVALRHLARLDNRLAAHHDGGVVAGADGLGMAVGRMSEPTPGTMFATAVVAIDLRDATQWDHCAAAAEAVPESASGLLSALGWVERDRLAGIGRTLLESPSPFRRRLGLAACRLHGVDPGPALLAGLKDESPIVRAEALRSAGELGRHQLVSTIAAVTDDDPDCAFWAAWSAVLLGDRERALERLTTIAISVDSPYRLRAFRLALQAMSPGAAHTALQRFHGDPEQLRWLIQGSGINGDPTYVPWLIKHMADEKTARIAGEAFSLVTGLDLALLDLERKPPETIEAGPNDNPDDENVEMDPDESLPWPDPNRIYGWWEQNGARFQPGTRYFMGAPVSRERCIDVLKNGYQRQRMLAAHYLCLLQPGTPLFNTSAPAWRQQRLLAEMA